MPRLLVEWLFWLCMAGVALVVAVNPLLIAMASLFRRRAPARLPQDPPPFLSVIVVAHAPGAFLRRKLLAIADLDYPADRLEVVAALDGTRPEDEAMFREGAARLERAGVSTRLLAFPAQRGKNACLNDAVAASTGEAVVFTDVDAIPAPGSLRALVSSLADPAVGGVGGRRLLEEDRSASLAGPQAFYWRLDARLKAAESRLGAVTFNDGKLYAVRRELIPTIPDGVTDDLFVCLAVLRQGKGFVHARDATALVPTPARRGDQEVTRRRRIVCRGLRSLWLHRALLDPTRHGFLAIRLFCNKVLRRLLPVLAAGVYAGSFLLSFQSTGHLLCFVALSCGLALAPLHALLKTARRPPSTLLRISGMGYYLCLGLYGTWLGLLDFLRGRRAVSWTPRRA